MNATDRLDHATLFALQKPDADQQVARRLVISEILEIEFHEAVRLLGVSVERAHAGRRRIAIGQSPDFRLLVGVSVLEASQLAGAALAAGLHPSPWVLWHIGMREDAERVVQERLRSARSVGDMLSLAQAMKAVDARRPAAACVYRAMMSDAENADQGNANDYLNIAELYQWLTPSQTVPIVKWLRRGERAALDSDGDGLGLGSAIGWCARMWRDLGEQQEADRLMDQLEKNPRAKAKDMVFGWWTYGDSVDRVRHWAGVAESEIGDDPMDALIASHFWDLAGAAADALRCCDLAEGIIRRRNEMDCLDLRSCAQYRHKFDPQGAVALLDEVERELDAPGRQVWPGDWFLIAGTWRRLGDVERHIATLDKETDSADGNEGVIPIGLVFAWSSLGCLDKALSCAERVQAMMEQPWCSPKEQPCRELADFWRDVGRPDRRSACLEMAAKIEDVQVKAGG